uniref:Leucine-rich repeat-containing N-terminal plant-type domain-containing protein n=1 Tax=Fagus sylvatica TaxID=28930 RepID=A0A2N9H2V4_FAGSY
MWPLCHDDESLALLQFKESFIIKKFASSDDPFAYPKVNSWTLEGESSDCCSWDGVSCDEDTGHVIGLDLSSSCLYGSINSNSSLFRLVHLQSLNLAHNHFNYSQIPSQVGNLSRLTYLNLSDSIFSGEIPFEVSKLSQLSSLDMGWNFDLSSQKVLLQLTKSLHLKECGMHGEFPIDIFMLPNLRVLNVNYNEDLTGSWPDFQYWSSPLEEISLAATSFSGELPASMGNLRSLIYLNLCHCNFSGNIPSSIGTFSICNITSLQILYVGDNYFSGSLPQCLHNILELRMISLVGNQFQGLLPRVFVNCTKLEFIDLSNNQFNDTFPSGLGNLPNLKLLLLRSNKFYGQILGSSKTNYTFPNLQVLDLSYNSFTGNFPLNFFRINASKLHNEQKLTYIEIETSLRVGRQVMSLYMMYSIEITNKGLDMVYSKVQESFRAIDISSNMFVGEIPESIGDLLKGLHMLNLSNNILTGHIPPSLGNLTMLESLDLSQNRLSGEIPPQLAQLTFLE